MNSVSLRLVGWVLALGSAVQIAGAEVPAVAEVEGQPVSANVERLLQGLEILGQPLPGDAREAIAQAARNRGAQALQKLLDPHVLFVVSINPELRVKVSRGPAWPVLHQNGFTPVLIKILNDGKVSQRLNIESPQAGAVYAGAAEPILKPQKCTITAGTV